MHLSTLLAQESPTSSPATGGILIAILAAIIYGVVDFFRFLANNRRIAKSRRPTFAEIEASHGIRPDEVPINPVDDRPIENGKS